MQGILFARSASGSKWSSNGANSRSDLRTVAYLFRKLTSQRLIDTAVALNA